MENVLLDVAIGLLLIYIALALLLMKLQESVHGGLLRGRVQNMHRQLFQAVGQDALLEQKLLENPLLFALYDGNRAQTGSVVALKRPKGPSSIPPDLFAQALLMELNPTGNPPDTENLTPQSFLDALQKSEKEDSTRYRLLQGLRGLAGDDPQWNGFQLRIATWFGDIGDRADGWYKRKSGLVGMWLALLLCLALNVDTNNIANTLGADPELRASLGDIAGRVLQQHAADDKNGAPATPADPALDPSIRAIARLVDANARISEAYFKDKAITRFGYYVSEVSKACPDVPTPPPTALQPSAPKTDAPAENTYVSNSDTWVRILPALLPKMDRAINRIDERDDVPANLRSIYLCLSEVSAWVRAASTASNSVDTRRVMLEAGTALEDSKANLLTVMRSNQKQGGLRRLFRLDPDAFDRCLRDPTTTAASMQACVLREQDLTSRIPLGHTAANWRQQFCEVASPRRPAPAVPEALAGSGASSSPRAASGADEPVPAGWTARLCGSVVVEENLKLHTPGMSLVFNSSNFVPWLLGIVISALFVSLGAPILFDTLSRWVRLKNSGPVRDAAASAAMGTGTLPLPLLDGGGGATSGGSAAAATAAILPRLAEAARAGGLAGSIGPLSAVEGSSNAFEDHLLPREIQALQNALGVQPITRKLDGATRTAIRNHCRDLGLGDTDRLSLATYTRLVGRPAVQSREVIGPLLGSRPQLRQPYALAASLDANLRFKLGFPKNTGATETTFSDALRGLAVLFRYKSGGDKTASAPIFGVVRNSPVQLDEIDEALLHQMLDPAAPKLDRHASAPWLDWALGELGQVEKNGSSRATSNPRVCEYLDAAEAKLGDGGDTTPWCGAFVSWVITQHNTQDAPSARLAIASKPAAASSWLRWQRPAAAADTVGGPNGAPPPQVGDVVVVNVGDGKQHVGFAFEINAGARQFWMLGGNQDNGTRVCLSSWPFDSIA